MIFNLKPKQSLFKPLAVCTLLFASQLFAGHDEVIISQERSTFQLDFNTTYVTWVNLDIQTVITLPAGYSFTAGISGSPDFITASSVQNSMYITKTTAKSFPFSNLTAHVLTPDGREEKLVFKLRGDDKDRRIIAIHLQEPNTSELNRVVEKVKADYVNQLSMKLSSQEQQLDTLVHSNTIKQARPWSLRNPKRLSKKYKGASGRIMGMINSRGYTYIYLVSSEELTPCNTVVLNAVGRKKKEMVEATFIGADLTDAFGKDEKNVFIYSVPILERDGKKVYYSLKIWSKQFTIRAKTY